MDDLFGDLPPPSETKVKNGAPEEEKLLKRHNSNGDTNEPDSKTIKCSDEKTELVYKFKSFIAERQGERDEMQDAATLHDDCTQEYTSCNCGFPIKRVSFHGVYDGHGGKRASQFAKNHLHEYIKKHFPKDPVEKFDRELRKRLVAAFKETDEEFLAQARKETPQWRDGSTAACVLAVDDVIYTANIGDSKTLLVRKNHDNKTTVIPLSKDHSPTLYEERQRIQNAGGFVREGRVQGVLEVSRAFGDARFKKYVVATPDIFKSTLTTMDRYLIIACDGLWKSFTVAKAVDFIEDVLKKQSEEQQDEDTCFETACKEIANEAVRKGSSDNVTVVLIRIFT